MISLLDDLLSLTITLTTATATATNTNTNTLNQVTSHNALYGNWLSRTLLVGWSASRVLTLDDYGLFYPNPPIHPGCPVICVLHFPIRKPKANKPVVVKLPKSTRHIRAN